MAKSRKQILKLLYMRDFLLHKTDENSGLSTNDLIDMLADEGIAAERKSIYSDIDALVEYGMKIEKFRDGNITRYRVTDRDFDAGELKLLVDAVQAAKFISVRKSNKLIRKLENLGTESTAKKIQGQVHVINRVKTMEDSVINNVDRINDAIAAGTSIAFIYWEWTAQKQKKPRHDGREYDVSPWALTVDNENYYLIAYDTREKKIKHFRVDKMMNIRRLSAKRKGYEAFRNLDMALYAKSAFGMFGGEEKNVQIRCKESKAGVLIDRFGQDIFICPDGDGYCLAEIKAQISPVFYSWIFTFSDDMEIVSPAGVRDEFSKLLGKCLSVYGEDK